MTQFNAALNCKNLDPDSPLQMWCPSQCGSCYRLCTTGGTTQGEATKAGVCRVFKVTNRCGDGYDGGNTPRNWCSNRMSWKECKEDPKGCEKEGNTNWFGYSAHFDLMDFDDQISDGLGWDNVEVTFEPVPCDTWKGPKWDCECPHAGSDVRNSSDAGAGGKPSTSFAAAAARGSGLRASTTAEPEEEEEEQRRRRQGAESAGAAPPPSSSSSTACAGDYQQCGGDGWSGPTCCNHGLVCESTNGPSYSQCRPKDGAHVANVMQRSDQAALSHANLVGHPRIGAEHLALLTLLAAVAAGAPAALRHCGVAQLPGRRRGLPVPLSEPHADFSTEEGHQSIHLLPLVASGGSSSG